MKYKFVLTFVVAAAAGLSACNSNRPHHREVRNADRTNSNIQSGTTSSAGDTMEKGPSNYGQTRRHSLNKNPNNNPNNSQSYAAKHAASEDPKVSYQVTPNP